MFGLAEKVAERFQFAASPLTMRAKGETLMKGEDAMLDWKECTVVEREPERVSGAWVFRGTRVPVAALFENLESGATVDDFLAWFPGVTRGQVEAVLEFAARSLVVA
jgi:uncharacterized protein (DUF433 family)